MIMGVLIVLMLVGNQRSATQARANSERYFLRLLYDVAYQGYAILPKVSESCFILKNCTVHLFFCVSLSFGVIATVSVPRKSGYARLLAGTSSQ